MLAVFPPETAGREQYAGVDDKWRCYQSPHFELYSHNGNEASRHLLHDLELLHAVFFEVLHLQERRPLSVTIYYFQGESAFRSYMTPAMRRNENLAGFYFQRPDRAMILLPSQYDSEEAQRLIFHEYIHHLTFISGERPALWYLEGIAELFSTIHVVDKRLALGEPIQGHVTSMQAGEAMPLEELFSTQHDSPNYNETYRAGSFYAQSWALLHYWYFGHSDLAADRLEPFINYTRQDEANRDPAGRRELFERTTGVTYQEMVKRLEHYMRGGHYGTGTIPLPKIPGRASYTVRAVPRDEIREHLLELGYRINRDPTARLALLDGMEKEPGVARRFEVFGAEALADGDENEARARWLQAIEAGSTNPAVYHELAMIENRRWFSQFDLLYFQLPDETAVYLRKLLLRSIEVAPRQTQAYEMLAWVEATAEKPVFRNVNLVQAHFADLQQQTRTVLALIVVRARQKDEAGARELMGQLEGMNPEPEVLRGIAAVRKYLDDLHAAPP